MPPAVKFCGIVRPEDATVAAELAAAYVGAILTESPRQLNAAHAAAVYEAARARNPAVRAVAVMGTVQAAAAAAAARAAGADVAQLHGNPTAEAVRAVRRDFTGEIWAVLRVGSGEPFDPAVASEADAVVLDTFHPRLLGGTGATFDWEIAAETLRLIPAPRKIVLAGGLRPSIVGAAIRRLQPDVVDVSSGVESSPGIKDHALMRAFAEAVALSDQR